jgi:hypothetical protein
MPVTLLSASDRGEVNFASNMATCAATADVADPPLAARDVLTAQAFQTVLRLQNSRMPAAASSRPYPESLTPPNGNSG